MDRTIYDALDELRALASMAAGSENGSGVDLGPTALIRAVAPVTVVESTGTLALKVQGCATESGTYKDIPGAVFLDPDDGATIDAVGEYEIYFKTDWRWLRTVSTVANAAVTWGCYLTKAFK